jgi:hypothetical protein
VIVAVGGGGVGEADGTVVGEALGAAVGLAEAAQPVSKAASMRKFQNSRIRSSIVVNGEKNEIIFQEVQARA